MPREGGNDTCGDWWDHPDLAAHRLCRGDRRRRIRLTARKGANPRERGVPRNGLQPQWLPAANVRHTAAKHQSKSACDLHVGWLSCDSVEVPKGPEDGFMQLLFDLASRSGFATYRVEKPGIGDSRGPSCGDADFTAELAAYRAAFAGISKIDFLDSSRIYILGFSNGGGFAPLVAGDSPVRGYLVFEGRSEERREGKECRSRWSPYH